MNNNFSHKVDRIVEYLNRHMNSTPSLQDLAEVARLSPYHFHRVYRAMTGETPMATLRRIRIARALAMLRDTTKPITEIAFDVGYDTSQAFSKSFRQMTGCSATQARANRDELDSLANQLSRGPSRTPAPSIEVRLVSIEPFKVISARHIGPPSGLFSKFSELFGWAEKTGLLHDFRGIYGIPIDDPREQCDEGPRFDCCFDFGPNAESIQQYNQAMLGGGLHAVARHVGPYEGIDDIYDAMYGSWIESSHYVLRNQCSYNHYLVDPSTVPAEQWETDIYIPIEKIV